MTIERLEKLIDEMMELDRELCKDGMFEEAMTARHYIETYMNELQLLIKER